MRWLIKILVYSARSIHQTKQMAFLPLNHSSTLPHQCLYLQGHCLQCQGQRGHHPGHLLHPEGRLNNCKILLISTFFGQTGLSKQCRPRSDCSFRRVYTVCHSICIFLWTHFSMVKPPCSNFRVITANFSGVKSFRIFTVNIQQFLRHVMTVSGCKREVYQCNTSVCNMKTVKKKKSHTGTHTHKH